MADEQWSMETLEAFAANYIIGELSMKNQSHTKFNTKANKSSSQRKPKRWREFRKQLFAKVRSLVRETAKAGLFPTCALDDAPLSVAKLAGRYDLVKLAIQVEVSQPHSAVSRWGARQLVQQLGCEACRYSCARPQYTPRGLRARHLAPALVRLRALGVRVRCTRAQLEDLWRRLCTLKTWQLYRLVRAGDCSALVPPAERADGADWELIDALLMHDTDERMQLVTMMLECLEGYRALVVLARLMALTAVGSQRLHPWRGRAAHQLWSRIHSRYNATGRSASIVLLQRRWHQLRQLACAALPPHERPHTGPPAPPAPLSPLLHFVAGLFLYEEVRGERAGPPRELLYTWEEHVRAHRALRVSDPRYTPGAKLEHRRRWYVDFKMLEQLQTSEEIDEYLKKRLSNMATHKCEFWEHTACSCCAACSADGALANLNSVIDTVVSNTAQGVDGSQNVSAMKEAATVKALERLDPNSAQVTVLIEDDGVSSASKNTDKLEGNAANVTIQNYSKCELPADVRKANDLNKVANESEKDCQPSVSKVDNVIPHDTKVDTNVSNVSDTKEESKRTMRCYNNKKLRPVEGQVQRMEHSINNERHIVACNIYNQADETSHTAKDTGNTSATGFHLREMSFGDIYVNRAEMEKEETYMNKRKCVDHIDHTDDEKEPIDSKLLSVTCVKLSRVDETRAWRTHAANCTIDVRRAGLLAPRGGRKSHRPADRSDVDDDCTDDDVDDSDWTPDARGDVWAAGRARGRAARGGRVVKKVELPDIEEVRRINSNILTAQVKPISLNEPQDYALEGAAGGAGGAGGAGEARVLDVARELELLDLDLRNLFVMTFSDLQRIMSKAIDCDDAVRAPDAAKTDEELNTADLFLDQDTQESAAEEVDEPIKKKKKRARRRKKTSSPPAEPEPAPPLDAYEEWERQKQIANKYFEIGVTTTDTDKKRKPVEAKKKINTEKSHTVDTQTNNTSHNIAEVTQAVQPATCYNLVPATIQVVETKAYPDLAVVTPIEIRVSSSKRGRPQTKSTSRYPQELKFARIAPRPSAPAPPDAAALGLKLSDNFLTQMLNAPKKEPRLDHLKYIIANQMDSLSPKTRVVDDDVKTDDAVVAGDDAAAAVEDAVMAVDDAVAVEDDMVIKLDDDVEEEAVTPVISAVCSLANTELIEDNPPEPFIEINDTPPPLQPGAAAAPPGGQEPRLAVTLTPSRTRLTVKVGDQLICSPLSRPPNVVKVNMSSAPQTSERPQSPGAARGGAAGGGGALQPLGEEPPSMSRLKSMVMYTPLGDTCNTAKSAKQAGSGRGGREPPPAAHSYPRPLSHTATELTAEFTTPESFVLADRRQRLAVVRLDLLAPIWAIGRDYVLLTEQNVPCALPGYWTTRDTPGPCQFLLWPRNTRSHEVDESNQGHQHSGKVMEESRKKVFRDIDKALESSIKKAYRVMVDAEDLSQKARGVIGTSTWSSSYQSFGEAEKSNQKSIEYDDSSSNDVCVIDDAVPYTHSYKLNQVVDKIANKDILNEGRKSVIVFGKRSDSVDHPNTSKENPNLNDRGQPGATAAGLYDATDDRINRPFHNLADDSDTDSESNELQIVEDYDDLTNLADENPTTLKPGEDGRSEGGNINVDNSNEKNDDVSAKFSDSSTVSANSTNDIIENYFNLNIERRLQIIEECENLINNAEANLMKYADDNVIIDDERSTTDNLTQSEPMELDEGTNMFHNESSKAFNCVLSRSNSDQPRTNRDQPRSTIKVKSFASVGRMEQAAALDADGAPDIYEKNNRFYKKLLDARDGPDSASAGPTYALMLSAVTSAQHCDRLLHEGAPLQVLERYRGTVTPLLVTYPADPRDPIRIFHHDERFLNDLSAKLRALRVSDATHHQMYAFVPTERGVELPGDGDVTD